MMPRVRCVLLLAVLCSCGVGNSNHGHDHQDHGHTDHDDHGHGHAEMKHNHGHGHEDHDDHGHGHAEMKHNHVHDHEDHEGHDHGHQGHDDHADGKNAHGHGHEAHGKMYKTLDSEKVSEALFNAYLSAFGMSLISFVGVLLLVLLNIPRLEPMVECGCLAFAGAVLMGDALIHLIPHSLEGASHEEMTSLGIAASAGALAILIIPELLELGGHSHGSHGHGEAAVQSHGHGHGQTDSGHGGGHGGHGGAHSAGSHGGGGHGDAGHGGHGGGHAAGDSHGGGGCCDDHAPAKAEVQKVEAYGVANLVTEGLHNFVDGISLGLAWLASPTAGMATTIAVAVHELPQELGDFMVLRAAGFGVWRLLFYNFLVSLTCVGGVAFVHVIGQDATKVFQKQLTAFTAGSFLSLALNMIFPQVSESIKQRFTTTRSQWRVKGLCLGLCYVAFVCLVYLGDLEDHDHGTGEGSHDHGHGQAAAHGHGHSEF